MSLRRTTDVLASILLFAASTVILAAQQRGLEPTIASVTAGQDSVDKVRSLYGKGAEQTVGDVRSLCYYVQNDQSYFSVSSFEHENRVRQISLTTFANVAPGCTDAKITGKHLTALAGISLGDSVAKVTRALGRPSGVGKLPMPNHKIVYNEYKIGRASLTLQYEHDKLVLVAVDASPE